ncbi:Crp/Fnr family transcriptional regulator [Amygdalobacter nucleatus]|uniref:Cyclic nucleotide-binding domain protein n=1 Tax=Amygdalobacter nucleatus TaxID=3029274 RepID=A0A133YFN3_9FIRM|nr:Crp/Fnr family transcriptional regulator [Amygdalobacter nucleatus]KXB41998.1 cyclic nucleotide-binding domain protein [Amygdalobacter nucleatus]MDF0485655.1 Crp/Fnr family transcriptional regulator [Amygdalobacter nucleatus]WEG36495.1 Crp/Fnr family transcriptional regulator [Amygdalobacter nucleatus]
MNQFSNRQSSKYRLPKSAPLLIPVRGGGLVNAEKIAILRDLSEADQNALAKEIDIFSLNKGDYCFRSGDDANVFYILIDGRCKIYSYTSDGREQILYIYTAGDFIGGLNLLKDHNYLYTGQAVENCLVAAIGKSSFMKYCYDQPSILRLIIDKCYDRIRWAENLINCLVSSSADAKVASVLLRLSESYGEKTERGTVLHLTINREEMGSYAGLARETMSRKLNQFSDEGLIEFVGPKSICIKDEEKLKRMI